MNRSKTCLLIDDDQDDQEIFILALNDSGASVSCQVADDGFRGLEFLDKNTDKIPDYIFLDLNMPGMNGRQCLVEIKKRSHLKSVPVIIYSTSSLAIDIRDTRGLGAADFITKPSSIKLLTKILSDFFEKHV